MCRLQSLPMQSGHLSKLKGALECKSLESSDCSRTSKTGIATTSHAAGVGEIISVSIAATSATTHAVNVLGFYTPLPYESKFSLKKSHGAAEKVVLEYFLYEIAFICHREASLRCSRGLLCISGAFLESNNRLSAKSSIVWLCIALKSSLRFSQFLPSPAACHNVHLCL